MNDFSGGVVVDERMLQTGRVQGETGVIRVCVDVREHQRIRDSSIYTLDAGEQHLDTPVTPLRWNSLIERGSCAFRGGGPKLMVCGSNGPCQQFPHREAPPPHLYHKLRQF
jgi:hypothetical protein